MPQSTTSVHGSRHQPVAEAGRWRLDRLAPDGRRWKLIQALAQCSPAHGRYAVSWCQ